MTEREFLNKITNSTKDFLQEFVDLLKLKKISYCIIGGLAVNAYAEPLVSLDLDIVIAVNNISFLISEVKKDWIVKEFKNSINITSKDSALRIQIQKDKRYQEFLEDAKLKEVLGYKLYVAKIEDVVKGKVWAYLDTDRRESKREKDLLDIKRLVEVKSELINLLPDEVKRKVSGKN